MQFAREVRIEPISLRSKTGAAVAKLCASFFFLCIIQENERSKICGRSGADPLTSMYHAENWRRDRYTKTFWLKKKKIVADCRK